MDFDQILRSTPTVRYYTPEPVDTATVYSVLERARFAPNGGNRQGWKVIVVTDAETRQQLRDLYLEPWNDYVQRARSGPLATRGASLLSNADEFAKSLHEVPVHLVICARMEVISVTDANLDRMPIVGGASIYPFVQNLILGFRAEGLGSTLTTVLATVEPEVKNLLNIPAGYGVAAMVSVGHPDPERLPRKLSRAPVEEFTSQERFDGPPLTVDS